MPPQKGLALRREEHGQGPAAVLAQKLQRLLVDGVDVGAFLPVDLDVDEELVHECCDVAVLEAFVGHDMAPVARRIPNAEEDGFVVPSRFFESYRSPYLPVHGDCPYAG